MMESSIITESRSESRQFGINVATNGAVIVLNVLVGLLFTTYLIDRLGIASYGLVVLAISLTGYMSIFETSINSAVGRFLTIDIRSGQFDEANKTFNTAFWSGVILIGLLLPVILILSASTPALFDVPAGQELSSRLLFAAVMGAYLLIILRGTFTASAFSYNRLDLKNAVFATNTIVRVLAIVLLFTLVLRPSAWQVGIGTIAGAIVSSLLAVWIWHALTPQLSFDWHLLDRSRLRSMFAMSGWLLINQMGSLLFLNIDLIIINRFLGVETQGRYGAILQLSILLRTLAAAIATAITPIALRQFASGDSERMALMTRQAVKWMGLIFALPIGCIVGMGGPFLSLWLGPDFLGLTLLAIVIVVHLCINLSVLPLFSIQTALNKVRWPGIVTLILGVLNLILAVSLVNWDRTGMGVAIAGGIVLTIKNALFTPLYGAHIQELPKSTFFREMLPGVLATVVVGAAGFAAARLIVIDSWWKFLLIIGGISLLYVAGIGATALNQQDRKLLQQAANSMRNDRQTHG